MNTFSLFFISALLISFGVEYWLSMRQSSHVSQHRDTVPDAFKHSVSLSAHQKAADYTLAKNKLGDVERIISIVLVLLLTFGGVVNAVFGFYQHMLSSALTAGLAAIATLMLIMALLELPVSIYQTFVIEERFGFNKSSVQQFVKDHLLQMILSAAIGLPLLALILWVMESVSNWWLWAWAILMAFSILMSWLYPTIIAPLFNTFTPIAEGSLKNRIQNLLERCGFNSQGIFIMDGSKRSGHGNAYFTGLGNNKRIVFFDNLVNSLDEEELEAVLAHELGHFKRKHVIKMLIANAVMTLLGFALLGWLIGQAWFYQGLGVASEQQSNASALLLFMLVSPVFTFFIQPIMTYCQRQFEFEADDFASANAKASKLISGLVKLYEENASTLTPDPLYSAFHYSHPPAAIRIAHLQTKA